MLAHALQIAFGEAAPLIVGEGLQGAHRVAAALEGAHRGVVLQGGEDELHLCVGLGQPQQQLLVLGGAELVDAVDDHDKGLFAVHHLGHQALRLVFGFLPLAIVLLLLFNAVAGIYLVAEVVQDTLVATAAERVAHKVVDQVEVVALFVQPAPAGQQCALAHAALAGDDQVAFRGAHEGVQPA